MISTDFAPNEQFRDAILSLRLLLEPWKWRKGSAIPKVKRRLKTLFFASNPDMFFYLTGRSGLYYVLKSLKAPKNAEVLVQGFTCEAVILPILANKMKPVYIDINEADFSMNAEDLEKKYTPEARVLILQHTFGITPSQRSKILAFARQNKLFVIEDIAHGFDPTLFQKKFKSTLIMSFGRSKSISSVFGGAVITTDTNLTKYLTSIDKLLPLPSFGFMIKLLLYKALVILIKSTYTVYIGKIIHWLANSIHILLPEITKKEKDGAFDMYLSKTFPNSAAILLLEQLRTFNDVLEKRKENCALYYTAFGGEKSWSASGVIRYPIISKEPNFLTKKLKKRNIYPGHWYTQVVAPPEVSLKRMRYQKGTCPEAEKITKAIINLPTNISAKQAQKVIKTIIKTSLI
ncbi:hypothetical protein BH09PAT2_BH09PAT2_03500 [soil metagenome]